MGKIEQHAASTKRATRVLQAARQRSIFLCANHASQTCVSEKISFQALRANPHTRNKRTVNVFPTHVSCFVYWETTLVVIVANCGRGRSERAAKKFKPMRRLGNDARGFSLLTYSFARLANRCSWKLLRVIGSFHLLLDLLCFCHGFRNSSLFQTLSRDHVKTWWKQQHNSKGPNDIGENLW